MVLPLCFDSSGILLLIFKAKLLECIRITFLVHSYSSGNQKSWCQDCYFGYLPKLLVSKFPNLSFSSVYIIPIHVMVKSPAIKWQREVEVNEF